MTSAQSDAAQKGNQPVRLWAASAVIAVCLWASSAPTMLYPVYADEMGLQPIAVTSLFAVFPVAVAVFLVLLGDGFGQVIGLRWAMIIGVTTVLAGSLILAVATNFPALMIGRAVEGIGVAVAFAPASATVTAAASDRPGRGARESTFASAIGLVCSVVIGGLVLQFLPHPTVASHSLVALIAVTTGLAVLFISPDPPRTRRWKAGLSGVRHGFRGRFLTLAVLGVTIAYINGAIFMSFAALIARNLTNGSNTAIIGCLLGLSGIFIAIGSLIVGRISARRALVTGSVISMLSFLAMAAAINTRSLAPFVVWCAVGGLGYAFTFSGGVGYARESGPPEQRTSAFTLVYVVSYFAQTLAATAAGATITALGLGTALIPVVVVFAVLCATAIIMSVTNRRESSSPRHERT